MRFLRLPSCKKLCLYIFLPTTLVLAFLFFCAWLPLQRSESHELAYFIELDRLESLESQWRWVPHLMGNAEKPLPYNKRLTPLIHDIGQLRSWGWEEQLQLYDDGFGQYPHQQHWIYVGGTYRKRSMFEKLRVYSEPNGSCVDEPYICDSFNDGFNRLLEYYHTHGTTRTSRAGYGFMDCDVSPLLCDIFGIDPVMLLHLETKEPFKIEMEEEFRWFCTTKWSLVSLPLKKMPFTKTQRIGGYVVPVFPSAFEQLAALVTWDGAVDALKLKKGFGVRENIVDVK